jgi:hypothetical protein
MPQTVQAAFPARTLIRIVEDMENIRDNTEANSVFKRRLAALTKSFRNIIVVSLEL